MKEYFRQAEREEERWREFDRRASSYVFVGIAFGVILTLGLAALSLSS